MTSCRINNDSKPGAPYGTVRVGHSRLDFKAQNGGRNTKRGGGVYFPLVVTGFERMWFRVQFQHLIYMLLGLPVYSLCSRMWVKARVRAATTATAVEIHFFSRPLASPTDI